LERGIDSGLGQFTSQSGEQFQTPHAQTEQLFVGRVNVPNRSDHSSGGPRGAGAELAAFQHSDAESLFRQLISDGTTDYSATYDNHIRNG
jgi:hypothetical protein